MRILATSSARELLLFAIIGVFGLTSFSGPTPLAAQEAAKSVPVDATPKAKALPPGAVVYSKPLQRGEHFYVWHGAWRDRDKGKKDGPAVAGAAADRKANKNAAVTPAGAAGGDDKTKLDKDALSLVASDPRIAADLTSVLTSNGIRVLAASNGNQPMNPKELLGGSYDLAIVPADTLATDWRDAGADMSRRLSYIARLFTTEIHVVAPAAITDLHQLAGKEVSVDAAGSSTAHRVFARLGIAAKLTDRDLSGSLDELQKGNSDAIVTVGGRSIAGLTMLEAGGRFHLIAVPYESSLQDLYYPARFSDHDYPNLVAPGEGIDTVAVGTVLAVFDATPGSARYRKLEQATEMLFDHFDGLLNSSRHPKWREVNLAARLPEWSRFAPAEKWLDRNRTGSIGVDPPATTAGGSPVANSSDSNLDQDKLFRDFLTWKTYPHRMTGGRQ